VKLLAVQLCVTSKVGAGLDISMEYIFAAEDLKFTKGKLSKGKLSMEHIVNNLCKHKMLRLGFFPLDKLR
jgi:hypothetical protein